MATRQDPSTLLEKQEANVKAPPMYQVVLLNDDYTPMEFVVDGAAAVLQRWVARRRPRSC
jgi:ATP-dependent Clp protease adaptor protein ClpS